jgi:hypothetical protein
MKQNLIKEKDKHKVPISYLLIDRNVSSDIKDHSFLGNWMVKCISRKDIQNEKSIFDGFYKKISRLEL